MKLLFGVLTIFSFVVVACNEDSSKAISDKTIQNIIGTDIYLSMARYYSAGNSEYLFIPDLIQSDIKILNLDGGYVKTVGRKGSGPGEFMGHVVTSITDSSLIAYDVTGHRVSIITNLGEFDEMISIPNRHTTAFFMYGDYLYAGFAGNFFEQVNNTEFLYKYDKNGAIKSRFGDFPRELEWENLPSILFRNHVDIVDDQLHVVYYYLPFYQIYDIESEELIYEINITEILKIDDNYLNQLNQANISRGPESILNQLKPLVVSFDANEDYTSFLVYDHHDQTLMEIGIFSRHDNMLIEKYSNIISLENINSFGILDFHLQKNLNRVYMLTNHKAHGIVLSYFSIFDSFDQM